MFLFRDPPSRSYRSRQSGGVASRRRLGGRGTVAPRSGDTHPVRALDAPA